MTRSQMIETVARKTGFTEAQVETTMDAMFDQIADCLRADEKVTIAGFGRFEMRPRKPKAYTNPKTKVSSRLESTSIPGFKASGRFKQKSMSDYVIPTSMDFPKQFYHIQENPYPWGPYGAKGMGELVFNGASAAYVDAVERALNTRFTSIPIPPEAIEEAMKHVH